MLFRNKVENKFYTDLEDSAAAHHPDYEPLLKCKYRLGKLLIDHNFEEVQERLDSYVMAS